VEEMKAMDVEIKDDESDEDFEEMEDSDL